MCIREDIIVSTALYGLTVEKIKNAKARKQPLSLTLRHVIIAPPNIILRKDKFSEIHVTITDRSLETRLRSSFGIICKQDSKLRFLYFTKVVTDTVWFVTCGGPRYCTDCSQQGPAFRWLGA